MKKKSNKNMPVVILCGAIWGHEPNSPEFGIVSPDCRIGSITGMRGTTKGWLFRYV